VGLSAGLLTLPVGAHALRSVLLRY
jgi:hypothetical protein